MGSVYIQGPSPPPRTVIWWLRAGLLCLGLCWPWVAHGAAPLPVYEPLAQRVGLLPVRSALPALIARAEEQVALCQSVLGEAHQGTGEALVQLGLLLLYHGEAARAEEVLRRSLGPLAAGGQVRLQALVGLSAALGVQRLTQESLGTEKQVLALREQETAIGELLLRAEVLAAATYLRAGEPGPALGLLRQAVQDSPLSGPRLRRAAAVWDLYAAALHAAGRWERAETAQREVVAALRQREDSEVRGADRLAAESNLAVLLAGSGREAEAEAVLQRAAGEAAGPEGVAVPRRPAEAALRGPGPAPEPAELLRALRLAEIADSRGQQAEAEAALLQALPLADGPLAAQVEVRLRLALLLLGARAEHPAVLLASVGDETGRSLPGPREAERVRQGLELLRSGAEGLAQEEEQVLPAQAPGWARAGLRGSVAALWGGLLDRAAAGALPEQVGRALLRAAQAPQLAQELEEELALLGQGRTGDLETVDELRALWRQRAALYLQPGSEPPALLRGRLGRLTAEIGLVEERLAQRSRRLRRLLLQRDSAEVGVPSDGPVVVFRRALVAVAVAARPEGPVVLMRGGRKLPPLRLQVQAPAQVGRGWAEHYAALWLQRGQQARLVDLGPVEAVDAAADRIAPLAERGAGAAPALQGELSQLGRLLLDPLALPAGRLYLVVPPELAAVPWAALPVHEGKALCQHGVPVVLESLADLGRGGPARRTARGQGGLQPMLLLGKPLYRETVQHALRLPEPQRGPGEMMGLNQLLQRHRFDARGGPLFALAATRTRLRAWLPAAVVHLSVPVVIDTDPGAAAAQERALSQLAAHAEAVPLLVPAGQVPARGAARAALVLAAGAAPGPDEGLPGAAAGLDQGLVSAAELARMDLSQTALFDLSSPAPQASAQASGAGLWALRQAAHRAGARGVVVSLWRGPERETQPAAQRLMLRVYRAWLQSGDAVEAVHRVQAEAAQRGESPAVWGALLASQ